MGRGDARRRPERSDHARGRSARRTPICGPQSRAAREGRPLRWVSLESPEEAAALAAIRRPGWPGRAWTSCTASTPTSTPETQPGLAVGAGGSKFGMTEMEIADAIERGGGPDGPLRPRGIHLHVGSQLGAVDAWRDAVRRGLAVAALWRGSIETFDTLDVGGGFPVFGLDDPAPSPARFARELPALLEATPADRRPTRLAIEPGRFLVARSGWLLARVLHVRDRGGRQVVLDAGMTELIRPALYGARHRIVALTSLGLAVDGQRPDTACAGRLSKARSANPPTRSGSTTSHHSVAATWSRSPMRAPTRRRSRRRTTAARARPRCRWRPTAG